MDDLITKAKMQDADAFTRLMQSQMQNMYKTARAVLYNDEDAADAISETILACWEKIGQLKQDQYFKTWMTRILVNKCNNIQKKRKNLCFMDELPEVSYQETAYENMEWEEAMGMLDEKYRLVFFLYYVEGFKTGEISSILEIAESSVRTRLARGRKKLAEEYYPEQRRRTV